MCLWLQVCNRTKVMTTMSLAQAAQQLAQHGVELNPADSTVLPAKDSVDISFFYKYVSAVYIKYMRLCCLKQHQRYTS